VVGKRRVEDQPLLGGLGRVKDGMGEGEHARDWMAQLLAPLAAARDLVATIGTRTLKHTAWGDGYEESRLVTHREGGLTVWYSRGGVAVGVLTHERDGDYERGREPIRQGAAAP
jgi:hypothetical protein